MKELQVKQGETEWFSARLGIPTASNFHRIISPLGAPSRQAEAYANELIAEVMANDQVDAFEGNQWTDRGSDFEAKAAEHYEFITGEKVREAGFCMDEKAIFGCSPDRFVGEHGLLEIKCPKGCNHISNLLRNEIDPKYIPQVQGQLLVTGRDWCDFMSYHPQLPSQIIRVVRNEEYIFKLTTQIHTFMGLLDKKQRKLTSLGYL